MKNTKGMVEGAIFSGLFIILLAISIYTPIGVISIYFVPVPFIIYGYRHGFKLGFMVIIINMVLAFILGGIFNIFIAVFAGSVGLVMGILYKKKNVLFVIIGGVITTIANFVFALFISQFIFGLHFIEDFKQLSLSSLERFQSILEQVQYQEQTEQIMQMYRDFLMNMEQLLPFIFISFALFLVWINHLIASQVFKRLGEKLPAFPPFRDWKFPKSIIYYYIITVIIILFVPMTDLYALKLITINLYPLLQFVLLIQGFSFIFYFFYHKNVKKIVPVMITIVSIMIPFLSQFINIIGLLDLGFDLRKKLKV